MTLADLIPDAEALIALEPDELGLMLLPILRLSMRDGFGLDSLIGQIVGPKFPSQFQDIYPRQYRDKIELALREAWAWLIGAALLIPSPRYNGGVFMLSRRAEKLARESDPKRAHSARKLPKDVLHPSIREDVWQLYHRGKYDTAVFEAMKAVEVAVREAGSFEPKDIGVPLIRRAFGKNGPLRDPTAEIPEADGLEHLFAGAIGSYKNPHSHRNVALSDPDEAAEIIMLANHLLRIVDARRPSQSEAGHE